MSHPISTQTRDSDEAVESAGVEVHEATAATSAAARDHRTLAELTSPEREELLLGNVGAAQRGSEARSSGLQIVRLSKNFVLSEFHCHDGTHVPGIAVPALRRLVTEVLQPMRDQFGTATIVSGYRHRAYNERIRGAQHSQHIYDESPASVAADVIFKRGNPRQWAHEAERLLHGLGGIGVYRTFGHFDNRPVRSRW